MKVYLVQMLVALVAAFTVLSIRAEDVWFDAGIRDYGSWPSDNGDFVVEGVGTWRGTASGALVGGEGAKILQVLSTADRPLGFTVDSPKSVASEVVTVRMTMKMSPFESVGSMICPPARSKGGVTCARLDGGTSAYFGLAKDPAGGTNAWVRLSGAAPEEGFVELAVDVKEEGGVRFLRYSVGGTTLTAGGIEWVEVAWPDEPMSADVSSVLYYGACEIASLAGYGENTVPRVGLTIPAVDRMTVASVKAGGVTIEAEDGVYYVPQGAVVSVRFKPDAGWALSKTTVTIRMGEEPLEFPPDEFPSAVSIGPRIRISEIMASNGSALATRNGTAGIDWAELYNSRDTDIDLSGGYMGNDPTAQAKDWTNKFKIQGSCVVPAHGYKIVWFDGDGLCTNWAADEAHVACNISTTAGKHTVFFSTTDNPADIEQQIAMPGMMKDVSYGLGHLERSLFGARDAAQYRVGGGAWTDVRGSVGMSAASPGDAGFTVTSYKLNRQLTSVDVVLSAIQDKAWKGGTQPSEQTGVKTIAYRSNGQSVSFPTSNYSDFPVATEDLALVVRGTVVIPESGLWTFSVGSDDGFRLTLGNAANSYSMEYPGARAYGQTYSAFNMDAGAYNLELVYFDRDGGAALDLSAAKGDYTTAESGEFSTSAFHLIGTADCPVSFGGPLAGFISTDVREEMLGKSLTLDWKASFAVSADELPEDGDSVRLKVRYADGLAVRLNGTEIARTEVSAHTADEALAYVTFEIDPALVRTENTLEIAVENDRIDDGELYLEAQVVLQKAEDDFVYFREPTPGAANTSQGYGPMTPAVSFSERHGYKTEPFELTLSCADAPYAPIYYTLDGTSPTTGSTLYTGPIAVSGTTCVRAAVPQDNSILQVDCAATYLFLADILEQSPDVVPPGFPADKAVNGHSMRYGLSASGLAADPERLRNAFTNTISTVSIVIDPKDLFDKANGIYVNPSGDGRSWERQMMLEQINPNGDAGFSVPAGIRIRGAASRGADHAKHSFRFFFRGEYGMGSLKYPLFGDEGTDEFDKVDLRCSQNYSWANENSGSETFIHECFSRDTQGAMGDYYTRSRYYNLFINGQYWGLYQTQERGDEDFAASYNGGAFGNYDVIKTSQPGYNTGASEGTEDAWKSLWQMIVNTTDGEKNYRRAMGLNEDGSRNEAYPVYLNPTNLIDYVLNFHFVCDSDAPISMSGFVNNLYAVRNRVDGDGRLDGFYFLRHDAEHSMGVRWESRATIDPTAYGTEGASADWLNYANRFSPAELFWRLTKNPEFRMLVADLYYKHLLKEGGALTAPIAKARFEKRMAEIDSAVVAEAARWSQNRTSPWTRDNWLDACKGRLTFIDDRGPNMLRQYRNRGWYPSIDAAKAVNALGGTIADGTQFSADGRLYLTCGAQGRIYYTTDGSDPRLADGTVADGAIEYAGGSPAPVDVKAFDKGAEWKYFDAGSKPADDWMAADFDDSAWKSGAGRLGFASSGTFATTLNRYAGGGSSGTQVTTFYFRKEFELPGNAAEITALKASLDCDDGYILYINGVEVRRDQVDSSEYDAFTTAINMGEKNVDLTIPAGLLKPGANVIAVEVHQCNEGSSDAWWDLALAYPVAGGEAAGLSVPPEGMTLAMRVLSDSGEWSAIDTVRVKGAEVMATQAEAVRVAGVYSSTTDGGDAGEFVIFTNVSPHAVDLAGVTFACCKHEDGKVPKKLFTVAGGRLEAGAAVTITQSEYSWEKITNGKVDMALTAGDGELIQTLYISASWFDKLCDGTGVYFVAKEFGDTVTEESQWRPSESWVAHSLRFLEMDGVPVGGGDAGEYFILSNTSKKVTLDLAGVRVIIGKSDDVTADESNAKCKVTIGEMTLAPGATARFDQATYWNGKKDKITNGDLIMRIYDAEGELGQNGTLNQNADAFKNYRAKDKLAADESGPVLRTVKFDKTFDDSAWIEYMPPAPRDWPKDPDTEITDETKPADLCITDGAFAESTPAELRKLAKWAQANGVAFGGAAVNAMAFDAGGNPATVFEEAYLLNCAPTAEAVAAAKSEFKFDAIVPGEVPSIEGVFNGTVKVLGSVTLGPDADWTPNNKDARFYKAVLTR